MLEDLLTPRQLKELLPVFDSLDAAPRYACRTSPVLEELRRRPAQGFARSELGPNVILYRGEGAPADKSLIVTLCGRSHRPNMAWSLFLQHLPSELFDVVILCDRHNNHYYDGIDGYAPDLLSLQRRVVADAGASGYRRVYFYGTSSGGLPAVRMGLMARAHRSIAVGGMFPWPIYRLQQGVRFQAFDPICACNARRGGEVLCIHASNQRDRVGSEQVERILKAKRVRVTLTSDHNVNYQIFLAGGLMDFHARLFEFDVPRAA